MIHWKKRKRLNRNKEIIIEEKGRNQGTEQKYSKYCSNLKPVLPRLDKPLIRFIKRKRRYFQLNKIQNTKLDKHETIMNKKKEYCNQLFTNTYKNR